MIKLKGPALLLFMLACSSVLWSQGGVKGLVHDEQGEPVPFATIYLKQTTTGTTTNELGEYEIVLDPGRYTIVFQGLGYVRQEVQIEVDTGFSVRDIQLEKQNYTIREVRVYSGGEDPAYPIMRKAISLAPFYLRQTARYEAEVYLKGSLKMEKIPRLIKRMMEKDADDAAKLEEGRTYTMESMNNIKFEAPDSYEHTVLNARSTFPGNNEDDVMGYITSSFYEPVQDIAVSPLAPNAFSYYKFVYEGYFYDGDVTVNKIKVVPKRKSQQTYAGYIYIVDKLWNLHSLDLTNEAFFGEINVKQVYAPIRDRVWLPISHRFNVKASVFGVKADFSYAGAVRYMTTQSNTKLPVPQLLMKQYAAEDAEKEELIKRDELLKEEKTKSQSRMEELLAKEELSNRDMIRLSRLIEKESRKQDDTEHESLEIKDSYKITHKKDTLHRDSLYWEQIRPIPLNREEEQSFILKDSLKLARVQPDSARIQKHQSAFKAFTGRLVSGHTAYKADSTVEWSYDGMIGLRQLDFNAVDGWSYGQGFGFKYSPDTLHQLTVKPGIRYAFNRGEILWNVVVNYTFAPNQRGAAGMAFGRESRDFNGAYGINRTLNALSALFFKEHYMKLYQKDYFDLLYGIDPWHGWRLKLAASFNAFSRLENHTNWSILKNDQVYAANTPENTAVNDEHLKDQKDVHFTAEVEYTPMMHYVMHKGRKYLRGSKYPTFNLAYTRGVKGVLESESDYELILLSVRHNKSWGVFNALEWQAGGGYYIRNEELHFSQFEHFNTNEISVGFKDWSGAYNLADDYSVSTDQWFGQANVAYTTPYLLLKFLPWVSNRLWLENIYANYLTTPDFKHYAEFGYGLSQIFLMGSVGTFVGFEDGQYKAWGIKVRLDIN